MSLVAVTAISVALVALSEGVGEVIIADYRDWSVSPAYYTDASRHVRSSMRDAIATALKEGSIICGKPGDPSWWCGQPEWRYFQGASGRGSPMKQGFACAAHEYLPHQRFYPEEMFKSWGCLQLSWNETEREYEVRAPGDV